MQMGHTIMFTGSFAFRFLKATHFGHQSRDEKCVIICLIFYLASVAYLCQSFIRISILKLVSSSFRLCCVAVAIIQLSKL